MGRRKTKPATLAERKAHSAVCRLALQYALMAEYVALIGKPRKRRNVDKMRRALHRAILDRVDHSTTIH
jgi:hypothetical protein